MACASIYVYSTAFHLGETVKPPLKATTETHKRTTVWPWLHSPIPRLTPREIPLPQFSCSAMPACSAHMPRADARSYGMYAGCISSLERDPCTRGSICCHTVVILSPLSRTQPWFIFLKSNDVSGGLPLRPAYSPLRLNPCPASLTRIAFPTQSSVPRA